MLTFYHGPLRDLSEERILTDIGQLWCADPTKRRFLRKMGVEEAIVSGAKGRYPFVLAYLDHLSGREEERAMRELDVLRLAPGMICYPEDLWDGAARRLEEGWTVAEEIRTANRAGMESDGEGRIGIVLPLLGDPDADEGAMGDLSLVLCADLTEACFAPAQGAQEESWNEALQRACHALEVLAKRGCRYALLTAERGLPPCYRHRQEELTRIWQTDPGRRSERECEALGASMLFALLPRMRRLGMRLLLRVGAVKIGDGWVDAGCDARSIAELAERLSASDSWPQTSLLPMTPYASMALSTLCGIFPSVDGAAAMEMNGDVRVVEGGQVLSLLKKPKRE